MKTLFDFVREPIIIGSFTLALLIVIGAYVGSHHYYGDVEVIDLPIPLALAPSSPSVQTSSELDFSGLSEQVESPSTQLESDLTPSEEKGISIKEFLVELEVQNEHQKIYRGSVFVFERRALWVRCAC